MISSPSNDTPVSLLERLRQPNDGAAWDRFVKLYTPYLYHCLQPLGVQESDRADLLQEVFLILYRKLPEFQYDPSKSFRGWLRTILLNKWRDARRQRTHNTLDSDGVEQADPADFFREEEYRKHLVNRALQLMQSDFEQASWQACWKTVVDGRPGQEVAKELGLTPAAVYAATYRVLRRLRQSLEGLL